MGNEKVLRVANSEWTHQLQRPSVGMGCSFQNNSFPDAQAAKTGVVQPVLP